MGCWQAAEGTAAGHGPLGRPRHQRHAEPSFNPIAPNKCPCCFQLRQVMTRMGAIMASGILDAGGRNATLGLRSRSGHFRWAALSWL